MVSSVPALDQRQAQAQWPTLHASAEALQRAVVQLAATHNIDSSAVDVGEAYLFAAWLIDPSPAIAAFTEKHRTLVVSIANRAGFGGDADEILHIVVQRLFVASEGASPKFSNYVGRGQLGGLVRVAATRLVVTRAGQSQSATERIADSPMLGRGVGEVIAKAQLQELVKRALEQSVGQLTERQRSLLRMHYVKQATIDDIALVYRVHRATAARWLLDARATLVDTAREAFLLRAALAEHELAEVASLVESQLSLTWSRLFGP